MLHQPTMVMFNKRMANSFTGVGADKLYQHVREKTWTIEQIDYGLSSFLCGGL